MAGRRERCKWCGVQLVVPPEARTIQCPVCQTTQVLPEDPISQASNWLKDFINTVSSNVNTMAATSMSTSNNYPTQGTAYGYGYYSQSIQRPPLQLPASGNGRKRALLCRVSYYGHRYRLKGSVNDVRCMRYFLIEKMGFTSDSILVLTEEEADPYRIPTKRNIRMAFQWLVQGCQSGDSLVFHYSGHGSQKPDFNGDEMDGYDKTLCPVDYETEGMIVDDEINDTIVRPLPSGAKLHAIIDACHSGTVLDLPFVCRMNMQGNYLWEDQRRPSAAYKGTSGGLALSVSACDDNQTSADTTFLTQNRDLGCGLSIFACFIRVFNLLGLLFLFNLGLKLLHCKGLIQFLCHFRGKSRNLRNGFCLKYGFDGTYNSKFSSSKCGLLKFPNNSDPQLFDKLEETKDIVNDNGDFKSKIASDEDSDDDEEDKQEYYDEVDEIVNHNGDIQANIDSYEDSLSDNDHQECCDGVEDEVLDVLALRNLVKIERKRANDAYSELEKERISAATAAEEAMAMILRLQTEKSLIELEANQYRRLVEEMQLYDQEVIQSLHLERSDLEDQLRLYRQKLNPYMKGDEEEDHCSNEGLDNWLISSLDLDM